MSIVGVPFGAWVCRIAEEFEALFAAMERAFEITMGCKIVGIDRFSIITWDNSDQLMSRADFFGGMLMDVDGC